MNNLNSSATFLMLEKFFKYQVSFSFRIIFPSTDIWNIFLHFLNSDYKSEILLYLLGFLKYNKLMCIKVQKKISSIIFGVSFYMSLMVVKYINIRPLFMQKSTFSATLPLCLPDIGGTYSLTCFIKSIR